MVAVGNPLSFKLQSGILVSLSENEMRKFFEFETLKHEPDEQYKRFVFYKIYVLQIFENQRNSTRRYIN